MREIKFRVWYPSKFDDNDNPVEFKMTDDWAFEEYLPVNTQLLILQNTEYHKVMQYTGLKDKNGKEIYEGDILKYSDGTDVSHHRIYWDDRQARWWDERLEDGDSSTAYDEFEFVKDCKVIGNIYENPELLK